MSDTNGIDLTPPTKSAKPPKAPKEPKVAKEPKVKAEKVAVDPNAPKKARAPRADYGFAPGSTIEIVEGAGAKFRGHRKEWFDRLVASNGKTVEEFFKSAEGQKDSPRGWLRFFVQDGAAKLVKPVATASSIPAAETVTPPAA